MEKYDVKISCHMTFDAEDRNQVEKKVREIIKLNFNGFKFVDYQIKSHSMEKEE